MKSHRVIWLFTILLVLAAAALAVVRQGLFPFRHPPSGEQYVQDAMVRLEHDPAAWERDTQTAVRAAAVAVERGELRSAQAYYVLALQYQREHNINAAEALFKRAIAVEPDWNWPYVGLGNLLGRFTMSRTEEAIQALRKAIALDPDWARPHNLLAVVYRLANQLDDAEREALEAVRIDPGDIGSHNNYANLLMARGDFAKAEEHYRIASGLSPEHPKPYYNLACLYSLQGRKAEALTYLAEALERAPNLREDAALDPDLATLRDEPEFRRIVARGEPAEAEDSPPEAADTPAGQGVD
jgi:Flp pilus assembly protein TadD